MPLSNDADDSFQILSEEIEGDLYLSKYRSVRRTIHFLMTSHTTMQISESPKMKTLRVVGSDVYDEKLDLVD